jgi:hypothetical protein
MSTKPGVPDQSSVQRLEAGLEGGFKFALSLLKEIRKVSKIQKSDASLFSESMLLNSLEYMFQHLNQLEAGSLFSNDRSSFVIDANLNEARAFLLSIVEDKDSSNKIKEVASRILVKIALARSNVEDLLIIAKLIDSDDFQIDLRSEIELLKGESNSKESKSGQMST